MIDTLIPLTLTGQGSGQVYVGQPIALFPPLSTMRGWDHTGALPEATYELCGDLGVMVAIGFPSHNLVYRGTWDKKSAQGSWSFSYWRN